METFDGQMIIKTCVMNKGYFESVSFDFDMNKICDRLRSEVYKRGISVAGLAREIGVSRDVIFDYMKGNRPEESMKISVLKSFAVYFEKEPYYFCNDYHEFLDTVETGTWMKNIRKCRGMTQRQAADYIGIPIARYKCYEQGKCRLPYEVYLSLRKMDLETQAECRRTGV